MTRRLYYQDVYRKEFDAVVTAVEAVKEGFKVFLDRSAFFPEGGGQSGDRGYLKVCGAESDGCQVPNQAASIRCQVPNQAAESDGCQVPDQAAESDGCQVPDEAASIRCQVPDQAAESDGCQVPGEVASIRCQVPNQAAESDGCQVPNQAAESDGCQVPDEAASARCQVPDEAASARCQVPGTEASAARVRVLDTQEEGEDVYVLCDRALPVGARVHGVLDWEFRFDRMQNHSGEHIVSGIIHRRFGYNNVGFHMSADRMTIDLSGEIPEEALSEIEAEANRIVWRNEPVITDVYTEEEAEHVEFRSKKDLHGAIRVVTIPGADVCACCGTHVTRTGEIGPIRLISHERFRGGTRIEMMCGRWAYEYMSGIFEQNHKVSTLVSAKPLETAKAVEKVLADANGMRSRLIQAAYERLDKTAEALSGAGDVLVFAEGFDSVMVQKLAARVMETCGGLCIAMSGDDRDGYRYVAGEKDGNLKDLIKAMNQELDGRGGGRPYFQQGSLKADRIRVEAFLKGRYENLLIKDL